MQWGSACQMSVHMSHLSIAFSHLIQAPCCIMPAILPVVLLNHRCPYLLVDKQSLLLALSLGRLTKPDLLIVTALTMALYPSLKLPSDIQIPFGVDLISSC